MKKQANTLPQFCRAKLKGVGQYVNQWNQWKIRFSCTVIQSTRYHSFAEQNWKRRSIRKSMKNTFFLHCNSDNTLPPVLQSKTESAGKYVNQWKIRFPCTIIQPTRYRSFAKQNWKRRPIRKSMKNTFFLHCNSANTLPQFCKAKLKGVGQHVKRWTYS